MDNHPEDDLNYSLCLVLLLIFIYTSYENYQEDSRNRIKLKSIISHKNVELPKIEQTDRLIIESVIEDYWRKRSLNKSNCKKIINSILDGMFRGAMGGLILGRDVKGAANGAIVFGAISGVFKAYNIIHKGDRFLLMNKHT